MGVTGNLNFAFGEIPFSSNEPTTKSGCELSPLGRGEVMGAFPEYEYEAIYRRGKLRRRFLPRWFYGFSVALGREERAPVIIATVFMEAMLAIPMYDALTNIVSVYGKVALALFWAATLVPFMVTLLNLGDAALMSEERSLQAARSSSQIREYLLFLRDKGEIRPLSHGEEYHLLNLPRKVEEANRQKLIRQEYYRFFRS